MNNVESLQLIIMLPESKRVVLSGWFLSCHNSKDLLWARLYHEDLPQSINQTES